MPNRYGMISHCDVMAGDLFMVEPVNDEPQPERVREVTQRVCGGTMLTLASGARLVIRGTFSRGHDIARGAEEESSMWARFD